MNWYYRKSDLLADKKILSKIKIDSISNYELFSSSHKDIIFIETVIAKCLVLSFEEYELLEALNENTYFSRASYDPIKKTFNPPFNKWRKVCTCNMPLNPDEFYVKCDMCTTWCHPKCENINEEAIENLERFTCSNCLAN